jgi:orotidine-5'-phosphate decarboxylase
MTGQPLAASRAPVAVALDVSDLAAAGRAAASVADVVMAMKIGLQLFTAEGPAAVEKLRAEAPQLSVFLDLKLHDIPATVRGAAKSLAGLRPDILTVHALGGEAMVAAAAEQLPDTKIAAVTILTSHTDEDLQRIGVDGPLSTAVVRLAAQSVAAGARALVCSPREVAAVRAAVGPDVLIITPGIRPAGAGADDQARISTPRQAVAAGADLLVIGRPITAAADPDAAVRGILAELTEGASAR